MKLIVTSSNHSAFCKCNNCDKIIADLSGDEMNPSAEECHKNGNVPIPNFGWFCSQLCATEYELKHNIKFARTADGKVDYYADGF